MKTRVALIGCRNASEGVWTLSKGNETGVNISRLNQGEHVRVDMEIGDLKSHVIFDLPGVFDFPWKRMDKYRVSKAIDDGILPSSTTVEVILDGSSHS